MAVEMHSVLTDQQMAAVMSEVMDKAEVHNYEKQVQLAPRDQPLIFSTGLDSPPSPASLFSVTPRPLPHSRFIGFCPQVLVWQSSGPHHTGPDIRPSCDIGQLHLQRTPGRIRQGEEM